MSPNSSGSTLIWRRSTARTVASVTGRRYVLPVRLSVTVSVSAGAPFSPPRARSLVVAAAGPSVGGTWTCARSLLMGSCALTASAGDEALSACDRRAHAPRRRRRRLAMGSAPGRARRPAARVVRVVFAPARADPAVGAGGGLGRLADRPADDQE